jgi:uncharacterized protein (TIGR02599 family)
MTDQTAKIWKYTAGKSEEFRESRTAFETMTTRISQATLNTYWDYNNTTSPTRYERRSELRFICGNAGTPSQLLGDSGTAKRVSHCIFFHAPLGFVDDTQAQSPDTQIHGLEGLLNVWGYFVELNNDANLRPTILTSDVTTVPLRVRFRLMEMMAPASKMATYQYTSGVGNDLLPKGKTYTGKQWYQSIVNGTTPNTHALAENVVALILHPEFSAQDRAELVKTNGTSGAELASNYLYDSTATAANVDLNTKDQLPPAMRVTMVAIDEPSAVRLALSTDSQNIFGLQGKFQQAAQFKQDLTLDSSRSADGSLENKLVSLKVNYRVFTTTVPIWGAKWSQSQAN